MPTRNINLTDRYDDFLSRQIETGRYQNVSEAVRAALHLLETQEREEEIKLDALRREAQIGLSAYERGELIEISTDADLDAFFDADGHA